MQNREYRRLCTKCGVRHYKPTGRKCTMSSPAIHLTPISSRRLSSATSCMQATMTTASIVTSLCTSAITTVTSSHMSSPRHLAGTPQGPMSSPHVVGPYPSSSAAVATSSSISVLPSTSAAAGPGIHAAVGSGSGSTGHPAAPIPHQPPPVQDQVVTTLHAMASIMSVISDRLTALERTDAPRPGPTPGPYLGAPAHQAQQPPVQMFGSRHSTYAPATAAPLPTTTQAMPTPAAVQAPPDMPTHPPHDLGVAARVQRELGRLGLDSTTDSDDNDHVQRPRKSNRKMKSGRGRTTQDFVVREVPWPHYGVYKGADRTAASFDGLSIAEFVFGYLGQAQRQREPTRSLMLSHLRELMQDAMSFPWPNVRNYHGVVLGQMEQAELDWSDRSLIQELRTQYSRTSDTPRNHQDPKRGAPCSDYQLGSCQHTNSHEGLLHACAYCWKVKKRTFRHPEQLCRSKQYADENETASNASTGAPPP